MNKYMQGLKNAYRKSVDIIENNTGEVVSAVGTSLTVGSSLAKAAYDTTAVTTGVGDAATAVLSIGASVVLVVLGIKVFKWIARSL